MSELFEEKSVDDLCGSWDGAMKIGPFGSQLRKEEMVEKGIKVYGQENVIANDWSLGDRRISLNKFRSLATCELKAGDVVVSMMGTAGESAIFPDDAEIGIMDSHLLRIQPDLNQITRDYFALALHADNVVGRQVSSLSHGSIMAGLSSKIVKSFKIPVPPLPEQPRVVSIIRTINAAIQRTEAIIGKLRQVKQGLLHDLLTRGIDANGDLRPSADEAPDLYQDSPVGRIPKAWTPMAFGRCGLDPQLGIPIRGETQDGDNVLLVKMGNLAWDNQLDLVTVERLATDKVRPLSQYVLEDGDVLFNTRNTPDLVGKTCSWRSVPGCFVYDNNLLRVRVPSSLGSGHFVATYLGNPLGRRRLLGLATGTTSVAAIYWRDLKNFLIPLPSPEEQEHIWKRIVAHEEVIDWESAQLGKLCMAKSGLMDDLLTGRVRVTALRADGA